VTALAQTKAIHALRRQIPHYTDADYRAYLLREFKVDSSTRLTHAQAGKVIETLKTLAGQNGKVRRASERAEGPYAAKLRALWISAYHLGVARSRDDKALLAFVERQTGLSHTRFLKDPADAAKAIEALKSWIAREAGVEWPQRDSSVGYADTKKAVAKAACRRLIETGAFKLDGLTFEQAWPEFFVEWCFKRGHVPVAGAMHYLPEHWQAMSAACGRWLRLHLSKKAKKKEAA
jgi:hypothetical protein